VAGTARSPSAANPENAELLPSDARLLRELRDKIGRLMNESVIVSGRYLQEDGGGYRPLDVSVYMVSRKFAGHEGSDFEAELFHVRRERDASDKSGAGDVYHVNVAPLTVNYGRNYSYDYDSDLWNRVSRAAHGVKKILGNMGDGVRLDSINPQSVRDAFGIDVEGDFSSERTRKKLVRAAESLKNGGKGAGG
jgi:hypothetical protein